MEKNVHEQLLNLENRILEDRKNLNDISKDIGNIDSAFCQNRIAMLEKEIDYMTRQIHYIKGSYARQEQMQPEKLKIKEAELSKIQTQESHPWYVRTDYSMSKDVTDKSIRPINTSLESKKMFLDEEYGPQWQTLRKQRQTPVSKSVNSNKDLEKAFGKSFMGIAASVLIFISLILFGTYVIPMMGDVAKMAIMYVVSFSFLIVGALRMKKDKDNRFNIALTGCGLGAIYISLLLTNIYFKVIGDIALYVLIAFWGGIVCLFAKNKNYIFQIIGEAGIIIATLFGCSLCIENEDSSRFIALLVFYGITSAIFYITNYEREFEGNLCYHIYAAIGSFIVAIGCGSFMGDNIIVCYSIAAVIQLLNIVGIMCHRINKCAECFGIIASVYMICLTAIFALIIQNEEIGGIVTYAIGMLMVVISTSIKKCENKNGIYILSITSVIIALVGLGVSGPVYDYGVAWLMIIPLLVYGYVINCDFSKIAGVSIMFMYILVYEEINVGIHFLFLLVAFIVAYGCMFSCKKQYNKYYKVTLHIGALLFIGTQMLGALCEIFGDSDTTMEIMSTLVYLCFFALNTICYKSKFACNFATGEKEDNEIIYIVANAVAMMAGLILISNAELIVCHLITILVALAAFMLKSKSILDKGDKNLGLNLYVGGKFTIFLIIVLLSLEAVNYVISIACLLLAILFILIGFKGEYRYIRIYGLGLTMISIFKLLMIDVVHENTLGYAISFFVSGLLCFAISMIYNYLDKEVFKM